MNDKINNKNNENNIINDNILRPPLVRRTATVATSIGFNNMNNNNIHFNNDKTPIQSPLRRNANTFIDQNVNTPQTTSAINAMKNMDLMSPTNRFNNVQTQLDFDDSMYKNNINYPCTVFALNMNSICIFLHFFFYLFVK